MKKLYTSYYGKSGLDANAYAISSILPPYLKGIRSYPALAPKWEFVLDQIKGSITWPEYIERFMSLIVDERKLNAHQIVDSLPDGAILLCYERSDESDFCHRRLVAQWIEDETGIIVPELDWTPPDTSLDSLIEW